MLQETARADAGLATFNKLFEYHDAQPSTDHPQSLRHKLQVHREHEAGRIMREGQLSAICTELEAVGAGIREWPASRRFGKVLARGTGCTYKKGYKASHRAGNGTLYRRMMRGE